jgi:hypothetical protein
MIIERLTFADFNNPTNTITEFKEKPKSNTIKLYSEFLSFSTCEESVIKRNHPESYSEYLLLKNKELQKPYNKTFYDKPYEKMGYTRKCTRPWDNCWFSNKPDIITLTVEQACIYYPNYMKWVYTNLTSIKWSVYTIQLLNQL